MCIVCIVCKNFVQLGGQGVYKNLPKKFFGANRGWGLTGFSTSAKLPDMETTYDLETLVLSYESDKPTKDVYHYLYNMVLSKEPPLNELFLTGDIYYAEKFYFSSRAALEIWRHLREKGF